MTVDSSNKGNQTNFKRSWARVDLWKHRWLIEKISDKKTRTCWGRNPPGPLIVDQKASGFSNFKEDDDDAEKYGDWNNDHWWRKPLRECVQACQISWQSSFPSQLRMCVCTCIIVTKLLFTFCDDLLWRCDKDVWVHLVTKSLLCAIFVMMER